MINIIFVCHGNICRSPMAEFIFKDMIKKEHLEHEFNIASAATSTEEIGNPVYPPVKTLLESKGLSCKGKRARQITKDDLDFYDYVILMDNNNLRNLSYLYPQANQNKIHLLMDFIGTKGQEVDDPWYTDNFALAYNDIKQGCTALLHFLKEKHDKKTSL